MTSAENSILEPPNLNIFQWRITPDPPTRLLAIMPPPGGGEFMGFQTVYCLQWAGNTFQMKHRLLFLKQGLERCLDRSTLSTF